jgi:hypothetical protein
MGFALEVVRRTDREHPEGMDLLFPALPLRLLLILSASLWFRVFRSLPDCFNLSKSRKKGNTGSEEIKPAWRRRAGQKQPPFAKGEAAGCRNR